MLEAAQLIKAAYNLFPAKTYFDKSGYSRFDDTGSIPVEYKSGLTKSWALLWSVVSMLGQCRRRWPNNKTVVNRKSEATIKNNSAT